MRYHYTCTRMVKKKLTIPHIGKDTEKSESSYIASGNAKWYHHLVNQLAVSYNIKYAFTIQPRRSPVTYPKQIFKIIFTLTLFIISKQCKQSKWPPMGERTEKMWQIHTTECHSQENNKLLRQTTAWINLKDITMRCSQTTKNSKGMMIGRLSLLPWTRG